MALAGALALRDHPLVHAAGLRVMGRATVEERVARYGEEARARLSPHFEEAGGSYPPARFVLVGFKEERELALYAGPDGDSLVHVCTWPILAASGELGPKLREGDRQVPEGVYAIESLNPNSRFHLALRLDYPNAHDRARGAEDGRNELGGDIMIHGDRVSIGCLAMGDEAAEELFVLAADTGCTNAQVLICPVDFRTRELPADRSTTPPWTEALYAELRTELARLP